MDSFELSLERLHARQMQFLKTASPDDWHRYADNHNWNDRLDGLFWIVSQPECDKATALLTFWKGEPTCYDYETEEEKMGDDVYAVAPMLRYIAERFNKEGYTRSQIAYDFLEDHGLNDPEYKAIYEPRGRCDIQELIERQKGLTNPHVKLHPDLQLLYIYGRKVGGYDDHSDYYDLFPGDVDDDGSERSDTVANSPLNDNYIAKGEPRHDMPMDAGVGASARIRALRHQADETIENASKTRTTDRSRDASPPVKSSSAPSMGDALLEAFGLFASMIGFGFVNAFAPKYLFSNTASALFWGAAIVVVVYCLYSAISNLRRLQRAVQELGLELSSAWITSTTTIAVLAGIALGRGYAILLGDPAVTPFMRYGLLVPAVAGLAALSYALARVLIHPRAVRCA